MHKKERDQIEQTRPKQYLIIIIIIIIIIIM